MLHRVKRHPVPVVAHFRRVLVLTYALRARTLEPFVPPGLELDRLGPHGFLAVALVQTERLRPAGWPRILGRDFFLAGYRVFTRCPRRSGGALRGLRILRSYTDRRALVAAGNLLTHYNYRRATVVVEERGQRFRIRMDTPGAEADLDVVAELSVDRPALPAGSPFASVREARRFAGPLPFTFDYEARTRSIVLIEGVRTNWRPRPVPVEVHRNTFLDRPCFSGSSPVLASAFYLEDVPYRWERGLVVPLEAGVAA